MSIKRVKCEVCDIEAPAVPGIVCLCRDEPQWIEVRGRTRSGATVVGMRWFDPSRRGDPPPEHMFDGDGRVSDDGGRTWSARPGTQLETDDELRERLRVSLSPRLSVQQVEMIAIAKGDALDTLARAFAGLTRRSGLPRDRFGTAPPQSDCPSVADVLRAHGIEPLAKCCFKFAGHTCNLREGHEGTHQCVLPGRCHEIKATVHTVPPAPPTVAEVMNEVYLKALELRIDRERIAGLDISQPGQWWLDVRGPLSAADRNALEEHLSWLVPGDVQSGVVVHPAPPTPDHAAAAYRARRGWRR